MIFSNNWCEIGHGDIIEIKPRISKADLEQAIHTDLSLIKEQVSKSVTDYLGSNPVLCLSGGIDSQAAFHLWDKSYPLSVVVFEFESNLNLQEVSDAVRFAEHYNIDLKRVKLNVTRFLNTELIEYADQYKISSPQFAVHCKFLDELKKMGYTGAMFGGNSFVVEGTKVYFSLTKAQLLDLDNFTSDQFRVVPNFLGFDKTLCLKLTLNTSILEYSEDSKILLTRRYQNKIETYERLALGIISQRTKKTGFEQIKKYYGKIYNDPEAFENRFRVPLSRKYPNFSTKTILEDSIQQEIVNYCSKIK